MKSSSSLSVLLFIKAKIKLLTFIIIDVRKVRIIGNNNIIVSRNQTTFFIYVCGDRRHQTKTKKVVWLRETR